MSKKKKSVDATEFSSYAEGWIQDNLDTFDILSIPGVINLVLEEYNNDIIDAFKKNQEEEREIEALRKKEGEVDTDDPDYEDKMDERLTSDQFKRKYYYR
jgi:hypothetical protein